LLLRVNRSLANSVKVFYDTSLETTTRATCGGSLLEGLMLPTHEQDEHDGLHDLGHRSIIPYAHRRESCIVVCVTIFKAELNLCRVEVV
jgi:hypothetical protein